MPKTFLFMTAERFCELRANSLRIHKQALVRDDIFCAPPDYHLISQEAS